jgi:hypothetical protein
MSLYNICGGTREKRVSAFVPFPPLRYRVLKNALKELPRSDSFSFPPLTPSFCSLICKKHKKDLKRKNEKLTVIKRFLDVLSVLFC